MINNFLNPVNADHMYKDVGLCTEALAVPQQPSPQRKVNCIFLKEILKQLFEKEEKITYR